MSNNERIKNYLAKDFSGLRNSIQEYIENYYPDKISDFSESGLAGMFVDMAAYVGDSMSYYLDFQFNELDLESAVDIKNIQKHMRAAGVSSRGPSPATVEVSITISIPSQYLSTGEYFPNTAYLPILRSGMTVVSNSGISFELIEDLDFNKKDENNSYLFSYSLNPYDVDAQGNPQSFLVTRTGIFISGTTIEESISINSNFVPFRRINLFAVFTFKTHFVIRYYFFK